MTTAQTEKQFLAEYNIHTFDVPLVTVDMAIFSVIDSRLNVVIVKRAKYPRRGKWALPGGFIDLSNDKSIEATAYRKLAEKTGLKNAHLEQVGSIGNKTRDPRGWSLTVAYMALVSAEQVKLQKDNSSEEVIWAPVESIGTDTKLTFDHESVVNLCHRRLKNKVRYTALPVNLLPEEFTLTELQQIFEVILEDRIEKKSFRRRLLEANIVEETGSFRLGSNRPAKLYRANREQKDHIFVRNIEGAR